MNSASIGKHNVGRIAERIVANELEYRGFRVSDLNKEGVSANADLLAAKDGKTWQIQVKGATADNSWWVNYGFCDEEVIAGEKHMFNKASGFYKAQIVILVAVRSPTDYKCVVLPEPIAEKAAQINLAYAYRIPKKNNAPKKPGKVWVALDYLPKARDASKIPLMKAEQELIKPFVDNWSIEGLPALS
jgi:hypothetical protein